MSSVFLSYARADDEAFVRSVYDRLRREDFDVWFDRENMPSRSLTFLQEIRDAIRSCERLVVALGPAAVRSDYVRAEWQAALVEGKVVTPVLRLGDYDLVPPELKNLHCPDARESRPFSAAFGELLRVLREPVPLLGTLTGQIPDVPPHFQPRPDAISSLAGSLLYDVEHPAVVEGSARTTVLQGMAGVGKSVLATAFARSVAARRVFSDGVLWVGATPATTPLDLARTLLTVAGRPVAGTAGADETVTALREWLASRRCLIVIDNAWKVDQVAPVTYALSTVSRLLVTSRDASLATGIGAKLQSLDVLDPDAALRHLADWVGLTVEELPDAALDVAAECGGLPFALAVQGALARDGLAWADLLDALRAAQLDYAEQQFPGYPYRHVLAALQVSVDMLRSVDTDATARFLELGAFWWDEGVTQEAIVAFWEATAGTAPRKGRKLLVEFERKALLRTRGPARHVHLHDLMVDYLEAMTDRRQLNAGLLDAYRGRCPDDWPSGPDDGYFHHHLLDHLAYAGETAELARLLALETIERRNAWFEATDRTGNVASYRQQVVRRIRDATVGADLTLRWSTLSASVNSLAANLPAPLLKALADGNVWSAAQALAYARQIPGHAQRMRALVALLPSAPEDEREHVLQEAVTAASHADDRMDDLDQPVDAMAAAGRTAEALTLARRGSSSELRTRALSAIADHLQGTERAAVIAEAMEACAHTTAIFRSAALHPILPLLDRSGIDAVCTAAVEPLTNPVARSWCQVEVVGRLLQLGDRDAACELAQRISFAASRAQAFAAMARAFGDNGGAALVVEALSVLQTLDDATWRAATEDSFQHLPPAFRDFTSLIVENQSFRAPLLEALAPSLSPAQIDTIEHLLRTTHDASFAAEGAAAIAAVLDPTRRAELLAHVIPRAAAIGGRERRVAALAALAGVTAGDTHADVVSAAFDAIDHLGFIRPDLLAALAPALRESDLDRALDLARQISDPDYRTAAIAALVPQMGPGHLPLARSIASAIDDQDEVLLAACALVGDAEDSMADELLTRIAAHPGEYVRARAVALLAPNLDADRLARAERLAERIADPTSLAQVALPAFARQATGPHRRALLRRAIAVAVAMDDPQSPARAIGALRDQLGASLAAQILDAFDGTASSHDGDWSEYRRALFYATALPALGKQRHAEVLRAVLDAVPRLPEAARRREVLSTAAGQLDAEGWSRAIAITEAEEDPYERALTAGFVIGSAPERLRPRLVNAALADIGQVRAEGFKSAQERRERAVARIFAYTHDPAAALEMVNRFESGTGKPAALLEFIAVDPDGLRERLLTMADGLEDPDDRAQVLAALAGNAPAGRRNDVIGLALDSAIQSKSELLHDRALPALSTALSGLSDQELRGLWTRCAGDLAELPRAQLLRKVHGLAPVIRRLGQDVSRAMLEGILEAQRWWP